MTRALIFNNERKVARCITEENVRNHLFFSEEQNYEPPFLSPDRIGCNL